MRRELARLEREYVSAGLGVEEARRMAALHAAQAKAFADRYGLDAMKMLQQRSIRLERAGEGAQAGQFPMGGALYQGGIADAALRRDSEAWGKTVDRFIAGELKEGRPITMLQQTPLVLQMLGAENRRLNATLHLLRDGLGEYHNLPESVIKQVPKSLADPVMVFKSETVGGDLVMMLEIKDQHGGTVVVPIALEQTSAHGYTVNLATSVYGKTNKETLKPNNQWFANQISTGNLLYQNKKKSRDWARRSKLQLPATETGLSTSAKNKIYTEADLVKLREEKPAFYQPVFHQYAGEGSAMSEGVRGKLQEARALAEGGTDNEAIRQQTGWFRGMDGKWRYEIPDDFKDINFSLLSQRPGARIPLPEIYNNPALYEAYPFLREISVRDMHDDEYGHGFFASDEGKGTIVVDRETYTEPIKTPDPFITLIHEIQHVIQDREGFARGGSPDFASVHPQQDARRIELRSHFIIP